MYFIRVVLRVFFPAVALGILFRDARVGFACAFLFVHLNDIWEAIKESKEVSYSDS